MEPQPPSRIPREAHWQERWRSAKLGEARRVPGRRKFFLIFAYPGTSGFMHIGHMRGYSLADALVRYHRMKGEVVFFPGGAHASGLPAVTFAAKVARRDPDTLESLRAMRLDDAAIRDLEVPENAARFLGEAYWATWERFGMVMDRTAYVTTIDPDYQQFIRWQFARLSRLGYLRQKSYFAPYCPRSGPVSVDPSETDISQGGSAEVVTYTLVPFALPDGRRLLAATLRPETVFGVTNLWVAPGETLVEWKHHGHVDLLSLPALAKVLDQWGGEAGKEIPATAFLADRVTNPWVPHPLAILESRLVDPGRGTGIVMSVPAHAPVDWVALEGLSSASRGAIEPLVRAVLEIEGIPQGSSEQELLKGSGWPAERAARNLGITSLEQSSQLAEATERLYRAELARGRMTVGPFLGRPVGEARELVRESLQQADEAAEIREFSEPVICRCGEMVVIRRIPDQWFLAYGDPQWKSRVRDHARTMQFLPPEYREELETILDWFEDRPAVRQGRWLGTPFPLDPRWIIEPIADSTLYPAYYVVRRFVAQGRLKPEQLTPSFFDHVFLGEGPGEPTVPPELQSEVRQEFLYWYPLDVNLGGKEHKRVHFPPFLYNHAALLPPDLNPRGIVINWWTTSYTGEKISKKDVKGGAVPPVDDALARWGADGIRLYHAIAGSLFQDVEWDPSTCSSASERVDEVTRILRGLWVRGGGGMSGMVPEERHLDRWFSTRVSEIIERATAHLESADFRSAAQAIYVDLVAILRRYEARGGAHATLLGSLAHAWTRMLVPFTPHVAEELGEGHFPSLVSTESWPQPGEFLRDPGALQEEETLIALEEDIAALLRTWKSPPVEARLFVASPWKRWVEEIRSRAPEGDRRRGDIGGFMREARQDPRLTPYLDRVARYLTQVSAPTSPSRAGPQDPGTETALLHDALPYFVRRFGIPRWTVLREEDGGPYDPLGRRTRAAPGRPAIYLVPGDDPASPEARGSSRPRARSSP